MKMSAKLRAAIATVMLASGGIVANELVTDVRPDFDCDRFEVSLDGGPPPMRTVIEQHHRRECLNE